VVLLAVKSQQSLTALSGLAAVAPQATPIVCLQNGIANEPAALRLFPHVYGVSVACPTSHLEPGLAQIWSAPVAGLAPLRRIRTGAPICSGWAASRGTPGPAGPHGRA
jgi:2-dehydropantoate 2-reductase